METITNECVQSMETMVSFDVKSCTDGASSEHCKRLALR